MALLPIKGLYFKAHCAASGKEDKYEVWLRADSIKLLGHGEDNRTGASVTILDQGEGNTYVTESIDDVVETIAEIDKLALCNTVKA